MVAGSAGREKERGHVYNAGHSITGWSQYDSGAGCVPWTIVWGPLAKGLGSSVLCFSAPRAAVTQKWKLL